MPEKSTVRRIVTQTTPPVTLAVASGRLDAPECMANERKVLQQIEAICRRNQKLLANRQVVLFGSRAHGTAKPRSDFDIGVCGASAMPYADFYSLADQIELLPTLYRIDWVDLARTDEQFRQSALANAKVIYEA